MAELLYRDAPGLVLRADGDGRTIHGLAVPFGEVIDVPAGEAVMAGRPYRERFVRGAFARSIAQAGHKVKLLVNHEARARLPIGRASKLTETMAGLEAEFRVSATRDGDEALELVRDGVVDGFSVGFRGIRHNVTDDGVVDRVEVALHEVSVTAFPAYTGALVAGVRSQVPELDVVRARLDITMKRFKLS